MRRAIPALLGLAPPRRLPPGPAGPSARRPAQPTFQTQVELVTVDVAVVDKKGQPVRGLTREDFVVTENGVPQALTSFEAVVVPEVPRASEGAAPPRRPVSTNVVADSRRGRTFVVVFDDIHLSVGQAQRARGAVAAFLESGVGDGDVVTLVASAGGAWWTARMPEGRDSLIAILKRLDGRYVPDPSPDRITEFEAMRIEEYQDEQMAWQVKRRFDAYGTVGQEKDARGVRPADAVTSMPGMIPSVVAMRAREVHQLATSRNRITLRADAARHRVAGRHQGPQGDGPRLPGLRLRRPAQADEGRDPGLAPPQRADLLRRHPGPPGAAGRLHRRVRPADRGPGHRWRSSPT